MKKILFYTTFMTQGGGIEVVAVEYLNEFIKKGYQVHLYVDYDMGDKNIREKEIDKTIKIKYLKPEVLSKIIYQIRTLGKKNKMYNILLYLIIVLADFFIWKKEIKNIKKENYDMTITFFQFLPSYITKVQGPKHLIFLHGTIENFFIGIRKYFKKKYLKKLEKFDKICTICNKMGEELLQIEPNLVEKQITIYNPINFDKIEQKSNDDTDLDEYERTLIKEDYICSIGRLDEIDKDFTTLIKAYFELLKENKIKEKLIIVGDGPDKIKLKKLVEELGISRNIIFLGRKNNPYIWLNRSKIFILSSKSEGFGMVLIEALVLNKIIISSDCPIGPREILADGKYGELFEVGNIKILKEKIIKVLNNREIKKINKNKYVKNTFKCNLLE